jgi:2-polyprenyl-3-methyl-5-hydroxy-6-metoxy-1,4-benzoquinol methylase
MKGIDDTRCLICGNGGGWLSLRSYSKPDKYEKWVGIEKVSRVWAKCLKCGFIHQFRNYDLSELEKIYRSGYRHPKFRGETIGQAYDRVVGLKDSENENRYLWFASKFHYGEFKSILDIGSGLGVWPKLLQVAEFDVTCIEANRFSKKFISEELEIPCYYRYPGKKKYDIITLVHVLEHIQEPDSFLQDVKKHIRPEGKLFIEVPDAMEFEYLDKEHDEFNSCHCFFYDMPSLHRLLDRNGFMVTDLHRMRYEQRNLSRIMCLATNK